MWKWFRADGLEEGSSACPGTDMEEAEIGLHQEEAMARRESDFRGLVRDGLQRYDRGQAPWGAQLAREE